MEENKDTGNVEPVVHLSKHGTDSAWRLRGSFFRSKAYKDIYGLGEELSELIGPESYFELNEIRYSAKNFSEALENLINSVRGSFTISRYKGLGEMNSDQLWDTTMDPEVRTLGRVALEDAQVADELFNSLMGDEVEPRRKFINENADMVSNLDI